MAETVFKTKGAFGQTSITWLVYMHLHLLLLSPQLSQFAFRGQTSQLLQPGNPAISSIIPQNLEGTC